MIRRIAAATLGAVLLAVTPCLADEDMSAVPTKQLIGRLSQLDEQTPGISDGGEFDAFMADDGPVQFRMGLLPVPEVRVPPVMRELARRGVDALPALIAHLNDLRPTRIVVGGHAIPGFGGQFFADEYFPRGSTQMDEGCTKIWDEPGGCRSFDGTYTIKVGDVCEVLIGQIANRPLNAARYQPTAIYYVNSPIETPSLAARIVKDWSGLDAVGLEVSLMTDLHSDADWRYSAALRRLRFYFPKAYAALSGDDATKRAGFEAAERKAK